MLNKNKQIILSDEAIDAVNADNEVIVKIANGLHKSIFTVKKWISDKNQRQLTAPAVINIIAAHFGVKPESLLTKYQQPKATA